MFFKILILVCLLTVLAYPQETRFVYNGFTLEQVRLGGMAWVTSNGLLKLGYDVKRQIGHAFHPNPVQFKNSPNGSVFSFSTAFVFAIQPQYATLGGHGIVFVVTPQRGLPGSPTGQYLGMFNETNSVNATNHVLGVELDTILNSEFQDINNIHVGINLNGLTSANSTPAGYYADGGEFKNLTLINGKAMQVWVNYNGTESEELMRHQYPHLFE